MRKRFKKTRDPSGGNGQALRIHNSLAAYLYLLPALLTLVIFLLFPLASVLRMGFYENYNYMLDKGTGFGLRSFEYVLNDPTFHLAVKNTLIIVGIGVPVIIVLSLAVALGINSLVRAKGLFQVIYFLPYVTSTFAIGVVFRWLFHSDYGLVNFLLEKLGLEGQRWLANMDLVMIPVTVLTIWSGLAFKTVLFLAGLQKIDPQLYSAAKLDGTPAWRCFVRITLPILSPTMWMVTIISVIHGFKTYNEVYGLFMGTGPGPGNSAITIVYYIFDMFFRQNQVHYASAAALLFLAGVMCLTLLQRWFSQRFVHYV